MSDGFRLALDNALAFARATRTWHARAAVNALAWSAMLTINAVAYGGWWIGVFGGLAIAFCCLAISNAMDVFELNAVIRRHERDE